MFSAELAQTFYLKCTGITWQRRGAWKKDIVAVMGQCYGRLFTPSADDLGGNVDSITQVEYKKRLKAFVKRQAAKLLEGSSFHKAVVKRADVSHISHLTEANLFP